MKGIVKTILSIVLLAVICFLVYAIINSVMEPVNFNKEKAKREAVAIQRLKDIRDLEVAFKAANEKFTANLDSLKDFYNNGKMNILMKVGSSDDSLAVAHTEAVRKSHKGITPAQLYQMYQAGDKNLVLSVKREVPVKDTLFHSRKDFNIDSLKYIPFSGGELVEMDAVVRKVSGVDVPLFEAKMPYKAILKGMDKQLLINAVAEREDQGRYPGLQVGSVSAPNNNAGNWE